MCKMAPLLGREMTECLFLAHFTQMCIDPLFHVRQVSMTFAYRFWGQWDVPVLTLYSIYHSFGGLKQFKF